MAEVQLLSLWASPYVMRVEMALVLKGVQYETMPQDLGNKSELLLQHNPVYKTVPVLLHGGKAVCESCIILQYVDETWPSPGGANLLPADAYGRAMARFWADFVDKKVFNAFHGILKASKGTQEEKQAAEEDVMGVLCTLEEVVGKTDDNDEGPRGPFFRGGEKMGLVDVMLAPLLLAYLPAFQELVHFNIPFEGKYPCLQAWLAACRAHPATSVLPDSTKVTEYLSQVLLTQNI